MGTFLALLGSGEYTDAMTPVDQYILNYTQQQNLNGPIILVPTAAGEEHDYLKWNTMGIAHLSKLGREVIGIDAPTTKLLDRTENLKLLENASAVYFSGGNPGYLYSQLIESEFIDLIKARFMDGMPIVGSSAGAMVQGSHFLFNPYPVIEMDAEPIWEKGFGLVSSIIIPHYDRREKDVSIAEKQIEKARETLSKINAPVIGIDEDTAWILQSGKEDVIMGNGKVHLVT